MVTLTEGVVIALVGAVGTVLGYLLRPLIDDHLERGKETRAARRANLTAQREYLIDFLGRLRAHFTWLESVSPSGLASGDPPVDQKVGMIADWVYRNAPRFPQERRGAMYLILNVAYQLGRGDRHFVDTPVGQDALENAWTALEAYEAELDRLLHT